MKTIKRTKMIALLAASSVIVAASLAGCSKEGAKSGNNDTSATTQESAVTESDTDSTTQIIVNDGSIIESDGTNATMTDSPGNASQGVQEALLTTEDVSNVDTKNGKYDVDLTMLSSTMVYSEVYNMMVRPDDYVGKYINMAGKFDVYEDSTTGTRYYACIIKDALGCCAQGIEFAPENEESLTFPDNYPDIGSEIAVEGTFEVYEENGFMYCRLKDAKMTF